MQSSFQGFPSPKPNGGGTNTGDATVIAAEMLSGKTAYAIGVKLTGTGVNAKRYVSGLATSPSGTQNFTKDDGSASLSNYITVSGLVFPNGIAFIKVDGVVAANDSNLTFYSVVPMITLGSSQIYNTGGFFYRLSGPAVVSASGFTLPVNQASVNYNYEVWGA